MTTVVEGEVLDVLPPTVEEKVGAMQRWTPDQQIDHVTELLVQSNVGLLVAIAAQDLPGIAEAKRKAATIQEIAKQLRMANDMQLHAAEFVRRAERGLGVGIREGQARGEVTSRADNDGGGTPTPGTRGSCPSSTDVRDRRPTPTDFAKQSELSGKTGAEGIYAMTDGVSDEMFEEALTEARLEGNLSRASVARRCKAKAQDAREVVDADDPLIDAAVAEPVTTKWPFRNSPTEFLAEITGSIAAFAENIKWITAGAVEPGELETLTNQARNAWKQINKHLKEINDV
ncbi:Uncharacterised protein [Mycobacteroides abscessus subsp. bolletii]|uniref:hypothetical protein n=1 Tax=Mycobacteroides abscessus TaxID=36809 RepID=UPI0009A79085|nr:hypothetical protein [Mycobacteroides abscessus]SKU53603.1 Uncharacterised protein [Mycobacteroides abscessus subsp. bolletii]